ncbi:MarR family winged helix-turn-helix transcriptional regulator [Lacicoccus alkaliphilus]|uniref:DNA-binding transcriptional regulator, MarR family n=2 Tax=Lacicoccus TaxID=3076172 RepID=A0A1M7G287_9BACL|nr:MarR family transcriptional regulator [Salinicoccus alkaliphilus]SHM10391.1 DNA-binding transcriptional regulator, MarR family [Salinicoccus alkaliphilus DSM 16010]
MSDVNTRHVCRHIYLLNAKVDHMTTFQTEAGRISREQLYMLEIIAEEPNITQKQLISRMKKEQTAISRSIQRMADGQLITKTQSREDLRASYLKISQKGLDLIDALDDEICEVTDELLKDLSKEEVKHLSEILEKLHR